MPKTLPEIIKIDRADHDRVSLNVEPYPWQKNTPASKGKPDADPFHIATIRLPKDQDKKPR